MSHNDSRTVASCNTGSRGCRRLPAPWTFQEVWEFIEALLASPSLHVLTETDRELPDIKGNLLHDAYSATVMREHGIGRILRGPLPSSHFEPNDPGDRTPHCPVATGPSAARLKVTRSAPHPRV